MKAEMTEKGFIIHRRDEEGKEEHSSYSEIRGAIVYPFFPCGGTLLPGYYLIFGKRDEMNEQGKYRLIFLTEGEDKSQDKLFAKFKDAVERLLCWVVYADIFEGERAKGKIKQFAVDLRRTLQGSSIKIYPPRDEDVNYETVRVREWVESKNLDIPQGMILHTQLKKMEEEKPDESYYTFTALHYLVGGFERDRSPDLIKKFRKELQEAQRQKALDKLDPSSRFFWENDHAKWKEELLEQEEYEKTGGLW